MRADGPDELSYMLQVPNRDSSNAAEARKLLRRKAVEFDEADRDHDRAIDYEDFCRYILPLTDGSAQAKESTKEWWSLMDADGDGQVRKETFFLWALHSASKKAGSGIAPIFRSFDSDGSGQLDEVEFETALQDMGFGEVATSIFEEHANSAQRTVSYLSLLKTVEQNTSKGYQ